MPVSKSFNNNILLCLLVFSLMVNSTELAAEDNANETNMDHYEDGLADFYGDEEFVTIATGTKQLISKAPSTATVITEKEFKQLGAVDIDEVLETVAGLHVAYTPNTNQPIYTFRGIYREHNQQVLMLVNGVPITNIFTGNRNQAWGGMSLEAVARIEVIRGPGSALFGADASAGVINIITKSYQTSSGTHVGYRGGSFSTNDFWLNHAWNIGDLGGFISYEKHKTDGYDQYIESDGQTILDEAFGTNASLAPGYANNPRDNDEFRVRLDYKDFAFNMGYQHRKLGSGLGVTETLAPEVDFSSKRWNADLGYNTSDTFEHWELSAKFSYFSTTQEFGSNFIIYPPGSDIGLGAPFPDGLIGNPEVFEKHYRTGVNAKYTQLEDHDLTIGLGYDISDLYKVKESKNFAFGPNGEYLPPGSPVVDVTDTPYVFMTEGDRKNAYLFVQDIWQLAKDWELTAGLRYDDYSDFGSTVNPRLALVWTSTLNLTTKFLYGSAFRTPSFNEMHAINNPANIGNPNLEPETIDTYELAFNYHTHSNITYGLSLYAYEWQDIIEFVPDEDAGGKLAQNTGEQQGYGLEAEFTWKVMESLALSGNYSWLHAENAHKNDVTLVPTQQIYLQALYDITQSLNINVKTNWVLDRKRAIDDYRDSIDDYNVTDLSINWQPFDQFSVSLLAKNLFDSDVRDPTVNIGPVVNLPNDLPLSGRAMFVQLTYHFE